MEKTPKIHRKTLSLSNRSRLKRLSASPSCKLDDGPNAKLCKADAPHSPSVLSAYSSSACCEESPSHKRINFDDSIDYSPKLLDSSFSPNSLLSQTTITESSEVGWRWGRRNADIFLTEGMKMTAENRLALTGGVGEGVTVLLSRQDVGTMRRGEQRKAKDAEIFRAEKNRANEMLQKRCALLEKQLKDSQNQQTSNVMRNTVDLMKPTKRANVVTDKITSNLASRKGSLTTSSGKEVKTSCGLEPFTEFFNDSASDCLLLEASQSVELQILKLTQKSAHSHNFEMQSGTPERRSTQPTTPTSSKNEKRSSFYLQFLEDEIPDDWFTSLDDEVLKATEAKKSRTSFQRYKSLPTSTITATTSSFVSTSPMTAVEEFNNTSADDSLLIDCVPKMKRHVSTHSINAVNSNYKGRHLHLRK